MWKIRRAYIGTHRIDKEKEEIDKLLAEGYEPFGVSPHIFMGDTLGETIYLRKLCTEQVNHQ